LHPAIASAMRAALPVSLTMEQKVARPHEAAARIAVKTAVKTQAKTEHFINPNTDLS